MQKIKVKVVPKTKTLYIYSITNPNIPGSYIGSTSQREGKGEPLVKRKQLHYCESVKYPNRKLYKECGNIRDCVFDVIETVDIPLLNFNTLRNKHEQEVIDRVKPSWNTYKSHETRTPAERRRDDWKNNHAHCIEVQRAYRASKLIKLKMPDL